LISQLRGKILFKGNFEILLDVNGVGYAIYVTKKLFDNVEVSDEEKVIITYLDVKENAINLYGFSGDSEREIFKMLMTVNGISARSAHTILCYAVLEDLIQFITDKKNNTLIKIPGIGAKKLDMIYITLHDKIFKVSQNFSSDISSGSNSGSERIRLEALNALLNLGYSRSEAERLIREVLKNFGDRASSTGELVKAALELI